MTKTPLQMALELPRFDGKQIRLAAAIGTSQQNISNWVAKGTQLPAELVLRAEAETGIPRHVWRPDIYPPEEYQHVATCGVCDRRASDPACLACTAPDCGLRQREAA